jgi:hypothetical protein
MLSQLSEGADWGAMKDALEGMRSTLHAATEASRKGDAKAFGANLNGLSKQIEDALRLCEEAKAGADVLRQVGDQIDRRERLVRSERQRLVQMQQSITAERAMLLVSAVVGIIAEHVHDRSTLAAISAAIGTLVDSGDAAPTGPLVVPGE